MGICTSHGFGPMTTAKLILVDGQLEEFSDPVKVSVLAKRNLDCFICNSDEMEFDGLVTAMEASEELRPGQLYFELPLFFLKRKLQAEDMASLAVKASLALSRRSYEQYGCYRSPKRVVGDELMFLHEENFRVKSSRSTGPGGHGSDGTTTSPADYCDLRFVKNRRPSAPAGKAGSNFKVSKFTATLSAIIEMEE